MQGPQPCVIQRRKEKVFSRLVDGPKSQASALSRALMIIISEGTYLVESGCKIVELALLLHCSVATLVYKHWRPPMLT
jgi:hypothetical protein